MNDEQNPPSEAEAAGGGAQRGRPGFAIGLFVLFLAMIGYGIVAGNVFDTYENGSNL
jgi:hypothetical protein